MANTRITAVWNGASGLPGYTRMRFGGAATSAEAATLAGRMRTYFDAIKALIPAAVTIGFQESAQTYSETGELTGDVGFTPPVLGHWHRIRELRRARWHGGQLDHRGDRVGAQGPGPVVHGATR